jgi:hypothetical protein
MPHRFICRVKEPEAQVSDAETSPAQATLKLNSSTTAKYIK